MKRLKDKVAIVTGGATGIGEAISKKFAEEGARVVVVGFDDDPVDEVVKEITQSSGQAVGFKGDISDQETAKECVAKAVKEYGSLHILINNAGVFPATAELQDYPPDVFKNILKNNIQTAFMMSRAALPELQKTQGNIVSAGSESGFLGIADNTPYGGSKGFMHAFMKGVAAEQARYGIRANCVCPGPVDTAWTHKETGPMDDEMETMVTEATAMGRRGTPEEIANAYLFIASDEASYVTGSLFAVDGGTTTVKGSVGSQAHESMKKPPKGSLDISHSKEGATEKK